MHIALATAAHLPHGSEDDQVLIAAMQARGMQPVPVVWDADARWSDFDIVVLRSIWDYHLKYARFREWLDALDAAGVPVHNSTPLVRWNADKRYMIELEQRGVRITPTRLVTSSDPLRLADIGAQTRWQRLVIKPTVASTGYETWMTDAPVTAAANAAFEMQKARMDVLVQEFTSAVHAGEISLVFLAGQYSHAVIKRAAGSEFRVHIEHGGTVESIEPGNALIGWAEDVIATIDHPWTYARVDAVSDDHGPMLMELELLDPELFFAYHPPAAERLIAALRTQIDAR
ncbi:MAG TPA: hypothetical protein VFO52_12270 [Longimicrobiales bacterium]|nr:hypothetical protein [Longimicrobiales bacterium]